MTKLFTFTALVLAVAAAGIAGVIAGRSDLALPDWLPGARASVAKARAESAGNGPIIYYRDPDGLAAFSAVPAKSSAGKAYLPVRASEDIQV